MIEFQHLEPGIRIEAQDQIGTRWQGTIDMAHSDLGIVWIRTDIGERKLLNFQEHTIRIVGPYTGPAR